ncbi:hypothetical protein TNCT_328331 [Trichonephila clavata]|uniref:Uncharacterized protein n=1 Tax=Trichonephila clavata TaxID=2740835 RepID=A0A8X6LIJ5_TRICU|nr:hypothetical protein TNCT_328331 [Trichonephila clavata]
MDMPERFIGVSTVNSFAAGSIVKESPSVPAGEHIRHKGYGESMTWNLLDGCVLEGEDDFSRLRMELIGIVSN